MSSEIFLNPAEQSGKNRKGITLLMMTITILAIAASLTWYLPRADQEVKRAKEDELRFILGEFRTAVDRFSKVNGRVPNDMSELISDSEGRRFLRKAYQDPFSKKADWVMETASDTVYFRSDSDLISLSGVPYRQFR